MTRRLTLTLDLDQLPSDQDVARALESAEREVSLRGANATLMACDEAPIPVASHPGEEGPAAVLHADRGSLYVLSAVLLTDWTKAGHREVRVHSMEQEVHPVGVARSVREAAAMAHAWWRARPLSSEDESFDPVKNVLVHLVPSPGESSSEGSPRHATLGPVHLEDARAAREAILDGVS